MTARPRRGDGTSSRSVAGRVVLLYAAAGLAWIHFTTWLLRRCASPDTEMLLVGHSLLGAGFVLATAAALYFGLQRSWRREQRLAQEKQLAEDMFHAAQKLEAMGSLAASMAHDFNNTLTVIRSTAEVAQLDARARGAPDPALQAIQLAALRAEDVVRQLMLFLRSEPDHFARVDCNALVRDCEGMIRQAVGRGNPVDLRLAPELPEVLGNRGALEQALLNLVLNARDAMAGSAVRRLTVETQTVDYRSHRTPFRPVPVSGRFVVIAIHDTGCGIPPESLGSIFEPFYTTKPHGTGLGLASVWRVADQHGGWPEVTSEPGRGSCFRLLLPAAASGAGDAAPADVLTARRGS